MFRAVPIHSKKDFAMDDTSEIQWKNSQPHVPFHTIDEHDADEAEWQEQQTEQVETPTMKRSAYAIPMDEWRLSHADNPHQLVSNPPTKKQPRPSRDCECCTIRAGMRNGYIRRSQTKFMCKACQVPLCVEPCFHVYHAFHHYKQEMRRRYNIDGGGQ
ncbi:hypothetical protein BaRGS_00038279 [Batillaria attramentaria]|uniref:PiggyBac transposable element-derived protein 4 C-terminal zinc-finger domain-containing protein n=1 Tax=Batillaria attramentaria TaxID=370345 RepID=A0ABD0J6C6_9CAEN